MTRVVRAFQLGSAWLALACGSNAPEVPPELLGGSSSCAAEGYPDTGVGTEPGDVLATGTNHRGLSSFMDGDLVELETEGLGRLHIRIRDDLKRTWSRDTRLEHAEKKLEGVTTPQLTGKYARKG